MNPESFPITERQRLMMNHIVGHFLTHRAIDITDLNALMPNRPSKQATQCSLKFLQRKGLVEPVRYAQRSHRGQMQKARLAIPTARGIEMFSATAIIPPVPSVSAATLGPEGVHLE